MKVLDYFNLHLRLTEMRNNGNIKRNLRHHIANKLQGATGQIWQKMIGFHDAMNVLSLRNSPDFIANIFKEEMIILQVCLKIQRKMLIILDLFYQMHMRNIVKFWE